MKLTFSTNETSSSFSSPQPSCQDSDCSDGFLVSLPSMPSTATAPLSQTEAEAVTGESTHISKIWSDWYSYLFNKKSLLYSSSLRLLNVTGTSRSSTPSTLACDPTTCPIIPGCETTIDISKGRTGLGLSIVGGCDTLLVGRQTKYEHKSAYPAAALS